MVAYLIDRENGCWDDIILRREFCEADVQKIKQIPISERLPADKLFWWPSKDGRYTTKSGYWIGLLGTNNHNENEAKVWSTVWNLEGPPKLRHFIWRATSEAIAVKENLAKRNIVPDSLCPVCHDQSENTLHALFDCDWAMQAWAQSKFMGYLFNAPTTSFKEKLLWMSEHLSRGDLITFTATAWAVWKARNDSVFKAQTPSISRIVDGLLKLVKDFKKYAAKVFTPQPRSPTTSASSWTPPINSWVKVNTDAGLIEDGWVRMGAVVRDHRGYVIAVATKKTEAEHNPAQAEAMAGKFGVKVAHKLGCTKVTLESDALSLVHGILMTAPKNFTPVGMLYDDILELSRLFLSFSCSHIRRAGNTVAHHAARLDPANGVEELYVNNIPQIILDLAGLDMIV